MPIKTLIRAAVEYNGKIYAINYHTLFCYDPDTDEWTIDAFNAGLRYGSISSLFKSEGFLYVATNYLIHRYDHLDNIWTLVR